MSQTQEEPKELTIEEIEGHFQETIPSPVTRNGSRVFDQDAPRRAYHVFGAKWAKERSDKFWKARLIKEVEIALAYADERLQKEVYLGIKEAAMMTNPQYIKELKVKYNV
jgi:hypothetical protein